MDIDFKKLVKPYEKEALETMCDLVKINSVYDEHTSSAEMPYGTGVNTALTFMKNIASKYGLKANIVGGRAIEIMFGSSGQEVGIFGHLDVVPVSGVWRFPPFSATSADGKIFGRGTSDDKGPLIASFFAVIALYQNGLIDDYKVRIVAGGDEERGSSCLEYYFNVAKKSHVDCGFTPDGDFPLIYGEKGITNYTLRGKIDLGTEIISIKSGDAPNIVIPRADVVVRNTEDFVAYLNEKKVKFEVKDNVISFIGKAAHGSLPQNGINAGLIALSCLGDFYKNDVLTLLANQYLDGDGKFLNEFYSSKNLGETTYNAGIINYNGKILEMIINFRFPETVNAKNVIEKIQQKSPLPIFVGDISKVLYFEPDDIMVQTLFKAYQEETGDYKNPIKTIGGGTYAKEAKNILAFGSAFPGRVDNIHDVDEKINLEDFYKSMYIYARGIYDLGKMKR
ncbi:MAG: Sapep family Mn(2+)-dependent dipeptidase [Bacilli bacterium]